MVAHGMNEPKDVGNGKPGEDEGDKCSRWIGFANPNRAQ